MLIKSKTVQKVLKRLALKLIVEEISLSYHTRMQVEPVLADTFLSYETRPKMYTPTGKSTLTEKLLLFGGAIQDAGAVKARAGQRKVTSDWMEIEKQRGISVTSTVLSFQYNPKVNSKVLKDTPFQLNLLDTPGHADFSEDTYRALAAADNCVLLVDAAKGIEDRTRKLFEVCRMRSLPVFTFCNKMDRPSLSPFEIIDQLEKEFNLGKRCSNTYINLQSLLLY